MGGKISALMPRPIQSYRPPWMEVIMNSRVCWPTATYLPAAETTRGSSLSVFRSTRNRLPAGVKVVHPLLADDEGAGFPREQENGIIAVVLADIGEVIQVGINYQAVVTQRRGHRLGPFLGFTHGFDLGDGQLLAG